MANVYQMEWDQGAVVLVSDPKCTIYSERAGVNRVGSTLVEGMQSKTHTPIMYLGHM